MKQVKRQIRKLSLEKASLEREAANVKAECESESLLAEYMAMAVDWENLGLQGRLRQCEIDILSLDKKNLDISRHSWRVQSQHDATETRIATFQRDLDQLRTANSVLAAKLEMTEKLAEQQTRTMTPRRKRDSAAHHELVVRLEASMAEERQRLYAELARVKEEMTKTGRASSAISVLKRGNRAGSWGGKAGR